MPPPSTPKDTVLRAFFTEGVNIAPGQMVNSRDTKTDRVEMEMHPAGVVIVGKDGAGALYRTLVPWARIKCVMLG